MSHHVNHAVAEAQAYYQIVQPQLTDELDISEPQNVSTMSLSIILRV